MWELLMKLQAWFLSAFFLVLTSLVIILVGIGVLMQKAKPPIDGNKDADD